MNIKNLFLLLFILITTPTMGEAAQYYVNKNGGTASQCNGLSDKPYMAIVSDITHDCAYNHPFWSLAPNGSNPTKFKGGDTLIIDGSDGTQYVMGWGAPNIQDFSQCHSSYPWNCFMKAIPSGPDVSHPTRILGKGWDSGCTSPTQLWGTERANLIINLNGSSNVELQCLDITDHSDCQVQGPKPCNRDTLPAGPWAKEGISASDSSNVLIKNVSIHGLFAGIHAGRLKNWTLEDSKIVNNSFVGWDGDIGAYNSSNSGYMNFNRVKVQYSGCGETLGLQPFNCYSQDQGGYGDGLGTHQTSAKWTFNDCDFSHNVSDGLDLLYHDGSDDVIINRGTYANNAGNQVKSSAKNTYYNSVNLGCDCTFSQEQAFIYNPATFNRCRAGGDCSVSNLRPGTIVTFVNSKFSKVKNIAILTTGNGCNGTEKISVDSITTFELGPKFSDPSSMSVKYYASGATGNGDGSCGQVPLNGSGSTVPPSTPPPPSTIPPPVVPPSTVTCNGWQFVNCAGSCGTEGTCNLGSHCAKRTCSDNSIQWNCSVDTNCPQPVPVPPPSSCPPQVICPVCPPPIVCTAPVLNNVSVNVTSNGQNYTLTK